MHVSEIAVLGVDRMMDADGAHDAGRCRMRQLHAGRRPLPEHLSAHNLLIFLSRMTHITLGCGGHRLSDVNHDQPDWLVSTAAKFGYGRVTVSDGYALKFEYIRTDVSDVHGCILQAVGWRVSHVSQC